MADVGTKYTITLDNLTTIECDALFIAVATQTKTIKRAVFEEPHSMASEHNTIGALVALAATSLLEKKVTEALDKAGVEIALPILLAFKDRSPSSEPFSIPDYPPDTPGAD